MPVFSFTNDVLERNPPRAAAEKHHVEQRWAGLGRVARAGAGEGTATCCWYYSTTALQLAALLCRCVGHVTPHRRTRRAAPGRAAPLHTPATTPLRQFESRRRVERRHRDTCRYCPCLSTGTTAQTAYRYNKKYKVYTHVRSAVGSYTRQYTVQ